MKWKEMLPQEMVMLGGIMNKKETTMSKGISQNKEKAMKIGKIMSQIRQMGTNMEATIQTETMGIMAAVIVGNMKMLKEVHNPEAILKTRAST